MDSIFPFITDCHYCIIIASRVFQSSFPLHYIHYVYVLVLQ